MRTGDNHPALTAHFRKYRSLMPSLALLFHLVDVVGGQTPIGPVTDRAAEKAIEWVEFLEEQARAIYGSVINGQDVAHLLGDKIRSGLLTSPFTERDVYRHHWAGLSDQDDVVDALAQLEVANWVRRVIVPTKGRSKTGYYINPKVLPATKDETP
jgi:hypothetical protein